MIDWTVAEHIARRVAGRGDAPDPHEDLALLAAESEQRVSAYTGLRPAEPLPPPEGISRQEWIASNIGSMRLLLDPVLQRAGERLGPLRPAMQIGAGLALSAELGVVLGYLGQRVLGQYELVLLDEAAEEHPPRLLFVLPNLGDAVRNFGADQREFVTWVALHEVTHAVQFSSVPWLQPHMAGLVRELLSRAELRVDQPRRLRLPSLEELRRTAEALRRGDLISLLTTPAERETFDRMQATMAVIEGHAEHVMDAVAPDLLPSLPRLRAALDRRRRTQSTLNRLVARLLGLELKMRQYEQGKRFCDAVVAQAGAATLHLAFSAPENLPSLQELDAPAQWVERVTPRSLPQAGPARG
jgi:coenzyme F420 biosynthesis associated uncharacterized protein